VLNNKLRLQEGGVLWGISKLTKLFTAPCSTRGCRRKGKRAVKKKEEDCLSSSQQGA